MLGFLFRSSGFSISSIILPFGFKTLSKKSNNQFEELSFHDASLEELATPEMLQYSAGLRVPSNIRSESVYTDLSVL